MPYLTLSFFFKEHDADSGVLLKLVIKWVSAMSENTWNTL